MLGGITLQAIRQYSMTNSFFTSIFEDLDLKSIIESRNTYANVYNESGYQKLHPESSKILVNTINEMDSYIYMVKRTLRKSNDKKNNRT